MSWSITTEVSSSPLVGSGIDGLIHDNIQIGAQPVKIDARGTSRCLGNHRSGHEPPLWNCAEFGRRHTISSDNNRLTGLYFAEYRARVVAKLPLGNDPAHGAQE